MLSEASQTQKTTEMLCLYKISRKANLLNSKADWCFPDTGSGDGESESVSCSVVSDSLWPHMTCSPLGSSVHGILQA